MATVAVINRQAGTSLGYEPEALNELLESSFASSGMEVTLVFVDPDGMDEALESAARSSSGMFIAGGGDGTINAAARYAMAHDKTLGILPMGTMNRLARDLDLPLDLEPAARLIATGKPRRIDAAEVNGQVFFCNSFFGLPALFAEVRAEIRGTPLLNRLRRYLIDLPRAAFAARHIDVSVDDGGGDRTIHGLAFAISNNPYDEDTLLSFRRGKLDRGELGFYATKHYGVAGVIGLLARIAVGRWDADPLFVRTRTKQILVHARRKTLAVTNDGELMQMELPLSYTVHPKALSVIAPATE